VVVLLLQCIPAGPQHLSLYFEGCLGIFLRWREVLGTHRSVTSPYTWLSARQTHQVLCPTEARECSSCIPGM
jgi:hypothetical protein